MSTLKAVPDQPADLADMVAAEVRAQMARIRMTQVQLAQILGISQVSVSERLRGKTPFRLEELGTIADALGVHPAVLLGGAPGNSPEPRPQNTDWFDQTSDTHSDADGYGFTLGSNPATDADLGMNAPVAA